MEFTQLNKDKIKFRVLAALKDALAEGYPTNALISMIADQTTEGIVKDLTPAKAVTDINALRRMSAEAERMWQTKYPS